jgi:hypothetical protein
MPFLSKEDRERYANPRICEECDQQIRNEYCSRCDEFYSIGHTPTCIFNIEIPHDLTTCGGDSGYR